MIARYGLRHKRVLSLGGGRALEERWLAELGPNNVTVIDLDHPNGNIEPVLRSAPAGEMHYVIGDALEPWEEPFDVLYLSGFAPDEMRRWEIVTSHQGWPVDAEPFHPAVMAHAGRLPVGGWMLVQSIGYSLDARGNPAYLPAAAAQMERNGLRLVEVHRFVGLPGVMLYAGLRMGPALTTFHGRAEPEPIERIYP
ncbi:MAG: hypothetical protein IT337_15200 [Thermomicrobiales bacterium]|nr:hypothetical protein [Thermomicrobiales bacterium]